MIMSTASTMVVSPFHHCLDETGKPNQARTIVELSLLRAPVGGCGRPHIPTRKSWATRASDDDRHDVEAPPQKIFQDHELIREDVSAWHHLNTLFTGPEERQSDQPAWPPIDKGWWRAPEILLSICEGVHRHERMRHPNSGWPNLFDF